MMEYLRCSRCGSTLGPKCYCYYDKYMNHITPDFVRTHIDFGLSGRQVSFIEYKQQYDKLEKK